MEEVGSSCWPETGRNMIGMVWRRFAAPPYRRVLSPWHTAWRFPELCRFRTHGTVLPASAVSYRQISKTATWKSASDRVYPCRAQPLRPVHFQLVVGEVEFARKSFHTFAASFQYFILSSMGSVTS